MKQWLYRKFRDLFINQIESDYTIGQWVGGRLMLNTETKAAFNKGYEKGNQETKDQYEALVDKQVKDKFSEINFLVNPNHIFQQIQGIPYLGQEPISKREATNLRSEAITLKSMKIWSLYQDMIRNQALTDGVKTSTKWEQVVSSKNMVYCLDILKSTVNSLANMNLDAIPDKVGDTNLS